MSAIFISHSSKDNAWAERIRDWLRERGYEALFLDFDDRQGIEAGSEWREKIYRQLRLCRAVIALCSEHFIASQWCLSEVAIAVDQGKHLFPVRIREGTLPNLVQPLQAIDLREDERKGLEKLTQGLDRRLNWRDKLHWNSQRPPYPGLPAFQEKDAPMFFGRDTDIENLLEKLRSLKGKHSTAMLLVLGASGCGKSSLVRAGVVPQLRAEADQSWIVMEPFKPDLSPFLALQEALRPQFLATALDPPTIGSDAQARQLLASLQLLRSRSQAPEARVVLVIDQFEELLARDVEASRQKELVEASEADRFLTFLQELLNTPAGSVTVLATMRTDFLANFQNQMPELLKLAGPVTLAPIRKEDYGVLVSGPAVRAGLTLQPGLKERLMQESGSGDALPLLAFTLKELWKLRQKRGTAVAGSEGSWWDLTLKDYDDLGGVTGSVKEAAERAHRPEGRREEETAALREAFLGHLVRLSEDGPATKQPARWSVLPELSKPILREFVEARLLVAGKEGDTIEVAHEALLRTWPTLKGWLEEGRLELEQRRRVKRLCEELNPERQPQALARQEAMEQLARMAATGAGESEGRAARKEAGQALVALVRGQEQEWLEQERADGALVLALIGAEEPLRQLLSDEMAPVGLRRRAAESLGLLAKRSGDGKQRRDIKAYLEGWLRSEALDVRIEVDLDPEKLDPGVVQEAVQQAQAGLQQALASGQLGGISEKIQEAFQRVVLQLLQQRLWAEGKAAGWKELDERLPLLQGASRGLQLAAAADLPLPGSDQRQVVPMLTLTALEEDGGLQVRTKVEEVPVWALPLPAGEQLELVAIPGGTYEIGSPKQREGQPGEVGRDVYTEFRQRCKDVDCEAERTVQLAEYWMVRHPISQAQWRAVVEEAPQQERGSLRPGPGSFRPEGLWEVHGQPGCLPVDSMSWKDARKWLELLNRWLERQWAERGGRGEAPRLALPSESQWEAACRAGSAAPFHFGATLDPTWANFDGSYTYGLGRKGIYRQRPVAIGFFGLVNRWGLAELHGQLTEWCGDQWHRDPLAEGWSASGEAREGPDPGLADVPLERDYLVLRGGSWVNNPLSCRAACRYGFLPDDGNPYLGLRPCCPSPPGSLLGA